VQHPDVIGVHWDAWSSLGGGANNPTAVVNSDGFLEVFQVGADNALWNDVQIDSSGHWTGFALRDALTGVEGIPTIIVRADGQRDLFVRIDGAIQHGVTGPGDSWSGFMPVGGAPASDVAVLQYPDKTLEVYAVDGAGTLWRLRQHSPGDLWP
jgi:hypothetical protein